MKYRSREKLLLEASLAERRWKRKLDRKSFDRASRATFSKVEISAPEVLSFSRNSKETLEFLEKFKTAVFNREQYRKSGKFIKKPISLDFSQIKRFSLPAAVVLAAELHRWKLQEFSKMNVRGYRKWSPRTRALMYSLGVFDLLGIRVRKGAYDLDPLKEVVLLRLQSAERRDGEAVYRLQSWLRSMEFNFQEKKFVFGALDEAIVNCIEHGYVDTGTHPRYPYAGHRWWATSCYDPRNHSLRFFVYDQGVGIPASLPQNEDFWPPIFAWIKKSLKTSADSDFIEGAFAIGRSRTFEGKRGKGLAKMQEAISLAGDGYLRVLSGKGDVTLSGSATIKKTDHRSHIGGTLIEWSIPIAALQDDGANDA